MRERSGEPSGSIENLVIGLTFRTDRRTAASLAPNSVAARSTSPAVAARRRTHRGRRYACGSASSRARARLSAARSSPGTVSELNHRRGERAGGGADLAIVADFARQLERVCQPGHRLRHIICVRAMSPTFSFASACPRMSSSEAKYSMLSLYRSAPCPSSPPRRRGFPG